MRITYLFDPLCGWCYGAGPALERLAARNDVTIDLAPTGLFAGRGTRAMDSQFAAYAWQNDQRIGRLTGQTFSEDYRTRVLGATNARFDSAHATLGLVAVGLTAPRRELEVLGAIQRARYIEGLDNAELTVVAQVLQREGFAEPAARVRSPDEDLLAAYRQRTEMARADMTRFGVDGVPALISGEEPARRLIPATALFGRFDLLTAELEAA